MPPTQSAIQILGERSAHFCTGVSEGVTSSHSQLCMPFFALGVPGSGPWEEIQESKMPSDQGGIQILGILLCTLFRKGCERWAPTRVPWTLFGKVWHLGGSCWWASVAAAMSLRRDKTVRFGKGSGLFDAPKQCLDIDGRSSGCHGP